MAYAEEGVPVQEKEKVSGLKAFNQRLRDLISPGTKLTEEEETIMNILFKIMNAPGTIKITPPNGSVYLVNNDYHYYVRMQGSRLTIINTVDSIEKLTTLSFSEYIISTIQNAVTKDAREMDETIFERTTKLLDKINDKVV